MVMLLKFSPYGNIMEISIIIYNNKWINNKILHFYYAYVIKIFPYNGYMIDYFTFPVPFWTFNGKGDKKTT